MLDNNNEAQRLALAKRLREALKDAEITPADLARQLERTPQAVTGWLTTGRISKDRLSAFASATGEDLGYLVTGKRATPPVPKVAQGRGRGEYRVMADLQHPTSEDAQLLSAFRRMAPDRRAILLALAVMLSSCATAPPTEAFQSFEGRPVSALTAKLGGPEDRQSVAGETWLTWTYVSGILSCRLSARIEGDSILAVRAVGHQDGCRQLAGVLTR